MSQPQRNSVAAFLSVLMTIIMVAAGVVGLIFLAVSSGELVGRMNGLAPGDAMPTSAIAASLIGALILFGAVIFVCWQLKKILATLASGDPFVPENAGRLSAIAMAVALTEVARFAIGVVTGSLVKEAKLELSLDLTPWIAVVALFVLAQIFKEGTRLRNEEKFTV
jgi:hypothetical protein